MFAPMLVQFEAVKHHHHKVLQLEPLEAWYHRELVLVLGSAVFLPVIVITIVMLFISLVKLWIIFISVVETLVIVASG